MTYLFASQLNATTNEMLWCAILGLTAQYLYHMIDHSRYATDYQFLKSEVLFRVPQVYDFDVGHLTPAGFKTTVLNKTGLTKEGSKNVGRNPLGSFEHYRIVPLYDYRFYMYRHWSIYEAMAKSPYIVSHVSYWRGRNDLIELLAKIGLRKADGESPYKSIQVESRTNFHDKIPLYHASFGIPQLYFETFCKYQPMEVNAADVVYCVTSILSKCDPSINQQTFESLAPNQQTPNYDEYYRKKSSDQLKLNFWEGYDAICDSETFKRIIQNALDTEDFIIQQAIDVWQKNKISKTTSLRYCFLEDASPILMNPHSLSLLLNILVNMSKTFSKNSKHTQKPMIMVAHDSHSPAYLVVGWHPDPAKKMYVERRKAMEDSFTSPLLAC
uniref:Uncharacterized protein n=1 Tax=Arcella intermedia TaxID=1963864 RepID=A0A6B2L6I7_9EUKA